MNNDHSPIRFEPRTTSGTTGRAIPERPEYGAPIPVSAVVVDRLTRGRPLERAEIVELLAPWRYALNNKQASPMCEALDQLLKEITELELVRTGSFQERLEALGVELAGSDDPLQSLAGKFVEIALLHLRGGV